MRSYVLNVRRYRVNIFSNNNQQQFSNDNIFEFIWRKQRQKNPFSRSLNQMCLKKIMLLHSQGCWDLSLKLDYQYGNCESNSAYFPRTIKGKQSNLLKTSFFIFYYFSQKIYNQFRQQSETEKSYVLVFQPQFWYTQKVIIIFQKRNSIMEIKPIQGPFPIQEAGDKRIQRIQEIRLYTRQQFKASKLEDLQQLHKQFKQYDSIRCKETKRHLQDQIGIRYALRISQEEIEAMSEDQLSSKLIGLLLKNFDHRLDSLIMRIKWQRQVLRQLRRQRDENGLFWKSLSGLLGFSSNLKTQASQKEKKQ